MVGEVEYITVHEEDVREAFMRMPEVIKIGKRTYLAKTARDFVSTLAKSNTIFPPIWKVVIPHINPETKKIMDIGANYYIAHISSKYLFGDYEKVALYYRGTYGYGGSGCYESALIEKAIELLELPIEVRSGDYLLALLFVEEG
ncbi:hypothetical protein DRO97_07600 [Archaeoglobales archaeon]|nr:MAG: hypothetical protein DRO97_07600 [Archaeoglobales archaeon]